MSVTIDLHDGRIDDLVKGKMKSPTHCGTTKVDYEYQAEQFVIEAEKDYPHVVRIVVDDGRREWIRLDGTFCEKGRTLPTRVLPMPGADTPSLAVVNRLSEVIDEVSPGEVADELRAIRELLLAARSSGVASVPLWQDYEIDTDDVCTLEGFDGVCLMTGDVSVQTGLKMSRETARTLANRLNGILSLSSHTAPSSEMTPEREELFFIKSYLSHQDQDANHEFIVRRINDVLAGKDPSPDITAALTEMQREDGSQTSKEVSNGSHEDHDARRVGVAQQSDVGPREALGEARSGEGREGADDRQGVPGDTGVERVGDVLRVEAERKEDDGCMACEIDSDGSGACDPSHSFTKGCSWHEPAVPSVSEPKEKKT